MISRAVTAHFLRLHFACTTTTMSPQGLRQRTPHQLKADQLSVTSHSDVDHDLPARDRIVWGQTP